jgi:hypothetical protein
MATLREKENKPQKDVFKAQRESVEDRLGVIKKMIDHGQAEFKAADFAGTVFRLLGADGPADTGENRAARDAAANRALIDEFTRLTQEEADLKLKEATAGLTEEQKGKLEGVGPAKPSKAKAGKPQATSDLKELSRSLNAAIQEAMEANK